MDSAAQLAAVALVVGATLGPDFADDVVDGRVVDIVRPEFACGESSGRAKAPFH